MRNVFSINFLDSSLLSVGRSNNEIFPLKYTQYKDSINYESMMGSWLDYDKQKQAFLVDFSTRKPIPNKDSINSLFQWIIH